MYSGELQVTLLVPDVLATVAFLERVFGFTVQGYWDATERRVVAEWHAAAPPDYAEVRAGRARIGLRPGGQPAGPGAPALVLRGAQVEAVAAAIRLAGVAAEGPALQPWGEREVRARDLNGYQWQFLEAIAPPG